MNRTLKLGKDIFFVYFSLKAIEIRFGVSFPCFSVLWYQGWLSLSRHLMIPPKSEEQRVPCGINKHLHAHQAATNFSPKRLPWQPGGRPRLPGRSGSWPTDRPLSNFLFIRIMKHHQTTPCSLFNQMGLRKRIELQNEFLRNFDENDQPTYSQSHFSIPFDMNDSKSKL